MAVIIDIVEAVVGSLNAATFSQPFTAERHYLPRFDLQEMDTLHVSVVPSELTSEMLDRSRDRFDYQVDVAVQKKAADATEVDALMSLVEQIADHLRKQPLAGQAGRCVKVRNVPAYSPKHLEELHQFTSVLTVTYRLAR